MSSIDRKPWQLLSNVLLTVGAVGFLALFLWSFGLIGYYSFTRPYTPSAERGWTFRLQWTHGAYGTFEENEQLLRLHFLRIYFGLAAAAGVAIRKVREKNEPWHKKQL